MFVLGRALVLAVFIGLVFDRVRVPGRVFVLGIVLVLGLVLGLGRVALRCSVLVFALVCLGVIRMCPGRVRVFGRLTCV